MAWKPRKVQPLKTERRMQDNEPVNGDYYYIMDGWLMYPQFVGLVRDLKEEFDVEEVRLCDMVARKFRLAVKR